MKNILVTICLLLFNMPGIASASSKWLEKNQELIEGTMKCKITDQIIIEVKDGQPKRYSHYTKYAKIGDSLILNYSSTGEKIKIILKHPKEDYIDTELGLKRQPLFFKRHKITRIKFENVKDVADGIFTRRMNWSNNKIDFSMMSSLFVGNIYLVMDRYYKSDWSGIFTSVHLGGTQTITLDCRHSSDKVEEIFDRYKLYSDKFRYRD